MVESQQIDDFISRHRPHAVCGACIALGSGMDATAIRTGEIAAALGSSGDFKQEFGRCALCEKNVEVIRRY